MLALSFQPRLVRQVQTFFPLSPVKVFSAGVKYFDFDGIEPNTKVHPIWFTVMSESYTYNDIEE